MNAIRITTTVDKQGLIALPRLELPEGSEVEIIILVHSQKEDTFKDLVKASETSLAFWDNPTDDAVWNNV